MERVDFYMYINAVANNVMLYLRHDFYYIIFKTKRKLYVASGAAPPTPQGKLLSAHLHCAKYSSRS